VRAPDRGGVSGATVGVIVVVAVALVTILVLFLLSGQRTTTDSELAASQPPPAPQQTIVQQPAAPPPVIIQQPAPVTQPAPVIVTQPAPSSATGTATNNDSTIQAAVDKRIADDANLSSLGITVTVLNGKATLMGQVTSDAVKRQVETAIRQVKGVTTIDNELIIVPQ
jgi:cytoskeletal protein RodZ